MAIESGKLVAIEIVLKVPVGLPQHIDPRAWAQGQFTLTGDAVAALASINMKLGTLTPNPVLQT